MGGEGRFDGLLGGGVIAMTENVFCAAMGGGKGVIAGVFVEVDHSVERTLFIFVRDCFDLFGGRAELPANIYRVAAGVGLWSGWRT